MEKVNLINWYKEKFILDPDTRNEIAQKNFNTFRISIIVLLIFALGNLFGYFIFNINDLPRIKYKLIYFGGFSIPGIAMTIYCNIIKNRKKKVNWLLMNFPFYFISLIVYGLSLYNFFVFKNYINGVIIFEIINVIVILLYNYAPLAYLPMQIITLALMFPTMTEKFMIETIADIFSLTLVIILFAFYKRKIVKKNAVLLNNQKHLIKIITFGNFTILHNGTVVKFQRKKSLELLAYLVYKKGSSVDSKELMTVLWGDRATSSVYGSNLRNLIVDIKQSLKKMNIMGFFIAEYNNFRINPSVVDCDYYNFLDGKKDGNNVFSGEFMSQFSWAEETTAYLENIK